MCTKCQNITKHLLFQEQSSSTVSEEVRLDPMPAETSVVEKLMVCLDVSCTPVSLSDSLINTRP